MHFNQHPQSKHARIGRSRSVKAVRPLPFDELYQLCENNFPEFFYIRHYPFCRRLQKYSSSGNEFEAGEQGKETDLVRISYVAIANNGEAADVTSNLLCAVDGLPDFPRIIRDIKRTAEAVISGDSREIQRLNLPLNEGPRMAPIEITAPQDDVTRKGSRPNDGLSMRSYEDLLSPPHTFTTGVVRRSRTIYWNFDQPPQDIDAQIIVALIQLQLLGDPSPFVRWFEQYAVQNFGIPAPSENRLMIAQDLVSMILSHHGLDKNYRAWRKYVRHYIKRISREHLPKPRKKATEADTYSLNEQIGSSREHSPVGNWSVADVARALAVSRQSANRSIRKLVRGKKLMPLQTKPLRIAETDVEMLIAARRRRLLEQQSRLRTRKKLEQQGKSVGAARKAINRKLGRWPSFFQGAS